MCNSRGQHMLRAGALAPAQLTSVAKHPSKAQGSHLPRDFVTRRSGEAVEKWSG